MKNLSVQAINQLRQNARSVVRELGLLNDAYFEIGVTLAERHLLIELNSDYSPTMGEIAERLLLDKSTVSRLIAKAVKKGYIQCATEGKDKRKRFLRLTEKGKEVLHAFEPIAFKQTKEALLTLTDEEVNTVYQGIALYAKGLKNSRLHNQMASHSSPQHENSNRPFDSTKKMEILTEIEIQLMKLGFVLKPFDSAHEEALYHIFRDTVKTGSLFTYESSAIEEFRHQFFHPEGRIYICQSLSGEVIGGFYIKANFSGRCSHIANAAYMIKETHRNKGIGTLMVKASLQLAKKLKFQAMQFNMVLSKNTLAVNLYKKLGFQIIGTIPDAIRNRDGSYQDGHVMYLKLDNC